METMIRDFEHMAVDLARQIAAEEERTGIKDLAHFAYSTFAKAAALRRGNLLTSVADLQVEARGRQARARGSWRRELRKLEPVESRATATGSMRKADRSGADDRLTAPALIAVALAASCVVVATSAPGIADSGTAAACRGCIARRPRPRSAHGAGCDAADDGANRRGCVVLELPIVAAACSHASCLPPAAPVR